MRSLFPARQIVVPRGTGLVAAPAPAEHHARPVAAASWRLAGGAAVLALAYAAVLHGCSLPVQTIAGILAVQLAATLSSVAGFAFAAIGGAMLFHLFDSPLLVVQVLIACSIANQALSVWLLRRDIGWRALPPFLAGGAIGVPLGVLLLLHLPSAVYLPLIGGVLTGYAAWSLWRGPVTLPWTGGAAADAGIGFLGGITGGLAGFPSAAISVWCALRGWDKTRQRGLYQPFILVMQLLAMATILLLAPPPPPEAPVLATGLGLAGTLAFVPASLLGTCCGMALFRRMSDRQFGQGVNLLLLGSGLALLLR